MPRELQLQTPLILSPHKNVLQDPMMLTLNQMLIAYITDEVS